MKKMLLVTFLFSIGSVAFAVTFVPPQPSLLGEWTAANISCTSNAPLRGGFKIGNDKLDVTYNNDQSFLLKMTLGGCETDVKGTYYLDGMKVNYSAASRQSCKETAPQPITDSYSMYIAYLSDSRVVFVATGDKAAMYCPAGDAAVFDYRKLKSLP